MFARDSIRPSPPGSILTVKSRIMVSQTLRSRRQAHLIFKWKAQCDRSCPSPASANITRHPHAGLTTNAWKQKVFFLHWQWPVLFLSKLSLLQDTCTSEYANFLPSSSSAWRYKPLVSLPGLIPLITVRSRSVTDLFLPMHQATFRGLTKKVKEKHLHWR